MDEQMIGINRLWGQVFFFSFFHMVTVMAWQRKKGNSNKGRVSKTHSKDKPKTTTKQTHTSGIWRNECFLHHVLTETDMDIDTITVSRWQPPVAPVGGLAHVTAQASGLSSTRTANNSSVICQRRMDYALRIHLVIVCLLLCQRGM